MQKNGSLYFQGFRGGMPGRIRTCDLQSRSLHGRKEETQENQCLQKMEEEADARFDYFTRRMRPGEWPERCCSTWATEAAVREAWT